MQRRAQAALEFLTTYGWAFLVILVMIGALGYFGIFDVSRFIPETCKLDGKLECSGATIGIVDEIVLPGNRIMGVVLTNNMNEDINITTLSLYERRNPDTYFIENVGLEQTERDGFIKAGQQADLYFDLDDVGVIGIGNLNPLAGRKVVFDIEVYYTRGNSNIQQVSKGSLTAVVN
jgi:hypothetical protein